MRNKAHAEICGNLGQDVLIKETKYGKKYGVISVAVEQGSKKATKDDKATKQPIWFPVFIWNQGLLDVCVPFLKKGKQVLVKGEIGTIPANYSDGEGDKLSGANNFVINIKSNYGITVVGNRSTSEEGYKEDGYEQQPTKYAISEEAVLNHVRIKE